MSSDLWGILLALTSAAVWGSADFSGGLASRRNTPLQVLSLSSLVGLAALAVCAWLWGEPWLSLQGMLWSVLAGLAGVLGLAVFYRGLSLGYTAIVAPTAAVVGAVLPVAVGLATEGLPETATLIGFAVAVLGIALVSRSAVTSGGLQRQALILALLAGIGFGGFFYPAGPGAAACGFHAAVDFQAGLVTDCVGTFGGQPFETALPKH